MIKSEIIGELMKVLKISRIGVYKRIEKAKQDYSVFETDIAAYCLAFKNGIKIDRYGLKPDTLDKVQRALNSGKIIVTTEKTKRRTSESIYEKKSNNKTKLSVMDKIILIGKKHGIENIDQNWVDSLIILNFIETASTKFLMEHDYSEADVKYMKWEEKLTKLQNKLFEEAKINNGTIRTSIGTIFKNYRQVRNDQDHIAHIPTSHITKDELHILQKNMDTFIKNVFVEHKKYCLK